MANFKSLLAKLDTLGDIELLLTLPQDISPSGSPVFAGLAVGGVVVDPIHLIDLTDGGETVLHSHAGGGAVGFDSYCKAKRTTTQSIPLSDWVKIQFNSVSYDNLNEFDETTNFRFTATASGYYKISTSIAMTGLSGSEGFCVRIYKNSAGSYALGSLGAGNVQVAAWVSCSESLYLVAGDFVEVYVYHNGAAARNVSADSVLCIERFV